MTKAQPKWRKAKNYILPETLRVFEGVSTAAIARKTGITEKTIRQWKSGETRHPFSGTLSFLIRKYGYRIKIEKQ